MKLVNLKVFSINLESIKNESEVMFKLINVINKKRADAFESKLNQDDTDKFIEI